jgi:hypothetical protein
MLRTLLLIFLFSSLAQFSFGQILNIKTLAQAEAWMRANPKSNGKLITLESKTDTSEILRPLYNKKNGFTFRIGDLSYKILQIDSTLSFRVSYIYFSGEHLSKNQIDSLRQDVISRYRAGENFFDLVRQYNMDMNINGDTGWFTEGMMVKEFEKEVRSHKRGDIFTVDTPEQNWYHVVLKTFDDTYIKTLTVFSAQIK